MSSQLPPPTTATQEDPTRSTTPQEHTSANESTSSSNTPHRSTRGASKQRRDQINVEIQRMRDLLPLSESIKDRLFQLQVMSLACIFIRKHRYKPHVINNLPYCEPTSSKTEEAPLIKGSEAGKAIRGFLLMSTKGGKMLYISENASEYLGHSVEEIMCQGDSIYDMVDCRDHAVVQGHLNAGPPTSVAFPDHHTFICRMNLSRTAKRQLQFHKFVLIQGRYIHPQEYYAAQASPSAPVQPIFAAFCQPLLNPENAELIAAGNTDAFQSQHYLDLKFREVDSMFVHHFNYTKDELKERSLYSLIHPDHIADIAYKHRLLCQEKEGSVLALVRMQSSGGDWFWLHTVLSVRSNYTQDVGEGRRVRHVIHIAYQIVNESEANALQANSWIYSMRHSYPTSFIAQDSPGSTSSDRPITPASPFIADQFCMPEANVQAASMVTPELGTMMIKQENGYVPMPMIAHTQQPPVFPMMNCAQIKVEIPCRQPCVPPFSMYTPENSSPESASSLPRHSGNTHKTDMDMARNFLDSMAQIINNVNKDQQLPELRDLDEFFKQEALSSSSISSISPKPLDSTMPIHQTTRQTTNNNAINNNVIAQSAHDAFASSLAGGHFNVGGLHMGGFNMGGPLPAPFFPEVQFPRVPGIPGHGFPDFMPGFPNMRCQSEMPVIEQPRLLGQHRHSVEYGFNSHLHPQASMQQFFSRKRVGSWAGV